MSSSRTTSDSRHRELARGLHGGLDFTCLVEAGAGTGKTSVLVDRLLSTVSAGTSVSRIVAITFTEKAAGELRVRFRSELERAIPGARETERARLLEALREIDRANIQTIHSFCAGLLRERPVEARVDPRFAVADDLRQSVLLESAWDAWIRAELAGALPEALAEANSLGVSLSAVREVAFSLAANREAMEYLPEPVAADSPQEIIRDLRQEAERFVETARAACLDREDLAYTAIEDFALEALSLELVPEESRLSFALTGVGVEPPRNKGKKGNWKGDALQELRDRAAALRERQRKAARATAHNATVGLLSWLGGFLRKYELEKSASGYLDFQDLLSKARDLLKDNRSARRHFKRAYDRILVDEFQDTDPLQCEIVFFLSERHDVNADRWSDVQLEPGKLFLVGDPKQSIYRFRRADIEMYELAKEIAGRQGRILELTQNFRTRPTVVEGVNSVFEEIMTAPEGERRYQPDYEELSPFRPPDEAGPGFVFIGPTSHDAGPSSGTDGDRDDRRSQEARDTSPDRADRAGTKSKKPDTAGRAGTKSKKADRAGKDATKDKKADRTRKGGTNGKKSASEARKEEAAATAAYIRRLLKEKRPLVYDTSSREWRPPMLGDIAILFHRTTGLDEYEEALNAFELEYRIAGGKRFYVRREVTELVTVLAAIDDPNDLVSVVGALRTPFFGVPDEDLVVHRHRTGGLRYLESSGSGAPTVERAFRILRELHLERNTRSVAELISRLFDETGALELYLLKPTGEQRHANLLKVAELAASLEKQEPMSFGGFVRWLKDVSRLTPEEAESPLAEEGDQFIRVLTIHKAKGLEFPIVILADLGRHRHQSDNLIIDREAGSVEYARGSDGGRLETLGHEDAKAFEKERATAETIRLLYVGATRARDLVVVPWFPSDGRDASGLLPYLSLLAERARDGRDATVEWLDTRDLDLAVDRARPVRLHLGEALAADPKETASPQALSKWRDGLANFAPEHDRPPRIVTPSSLGHERSPRDEVAVTRNDGTALGLLVHAVLEKAHLGETDGLPELVSTVARAVGTTEDVAVQAERMAASAIRSKAVLRAVGSCACHREVPFCVRRGDLILEGKIDLMFEDDGRLTIVDYKTDAEPPSGFGSLIDRYRGQALAYSVAAEAATGMQVSEVVLLFLSGDEPQEHVVALDEDLESRWQALETLARERA